MDLLIQFGWLTAGLVFLFFGAEWLVKGSAALALRMGVSPLVVGLTVVAFGTSAPELLASIKANMQTPPQGGLALGNVVGSNICNVALVLGLSALIRPLAIDGQVGRRDLPVLIVATGLFLFFLRDAQFAVWEGAVFATAIVAYTVISLVIARRDGQSQSDEFSAEEIAEMKQGGSKQTLFDIGLILVGFALLVLGADWLVSSGLAIARALSVPEAIIGLTMIALGTSLPELATSVAAVRQGQGDIIVGNIIGSCIFNLLAVVGITACIAPIAGGQITGVDFGVLSMVTVAVALMTWCGAKARRWHGAALLIAYLSYCGYLTAQTM